MFLQVALAISGGEVRQSFAVECPCARARGPMWPVRVAFPFPGSGAADPDSVRLEAADSGARRWCRRRRSWVEAPWSSRLEDFPSAWGLLPFQGQREEAAAVRPRHVLLGDGDISLQKDCVVISIFVGFLSVISEP